MADGIGGICRRGWQYWVEQEGVTGMRMPANIVPRDGDQVAAEPLDLSAAPTTGKPPYRVPSMAEIAALPWSRFKVISTFAGCGGSSLGYRMAGFRVLWASEFIDAARTVYQDNAGPGTIVDGRDIRQVDPLDVLKRVGLKVGELDVLDGSPPCASFSTAGKREKHWGQVKKYSDKEQRTDDLFFEYARFVRAMQPRVFVAENVSGLVKGKAKGYFLEILAELKSCGYRVGARVLDAQWLGVPQQRQRLVYVGVREDLALDPAHPSPLAYRYSVREAIPWITRAVHDTSGQWGAGDITDRPSPTVTVGVNSVNSNHYQVVQGRRGSSFNKAGKPFDPDEPIATVVADGGRKNDAQFMVMQKDRYDSEVDITDRPALTIRASESSAPVIVEKETDISRYAIGDEADKLGPGQRSNRFFQLERADPSQPSPAILASSANFPSAACVIHPTEKRKFSIAELKRICAFPDDFKLSGSYGQQWERLGRAVPPVMMSHIAATVRDQILRKIPCAESRARSTGETSTSRAPSKRSATAGPTATASLRKGRRRTATSGSRSST